MYARLKFRILLSCFRVKQGSQHVSDQLANLHSDTLRDLAPFLCMERSNRIPMEICLAARNEHQRTNGPVNADRRPSCHFFFHVKA